MLAITLKPGAYATIGDDIKVYNNGDYDARIAIEAPKDLKILRSNMKERPTQEA